MTSLFRPWANEMKTGKGETDQIAKIGSNVKAESKKWCPTEADQCNTCVSEILDDRETRYHNVKEHIKKRSEKSLLKRCKLSDEGKQRITNMKIEPPQSWSATKSDVVCPEMSYLNLPIPGYPQVLDISPEDGPGNCFLPTYNNLYAGSELLDAALAQGFSGNLFEEYARFLTEQQKQVAERTRKQRPKKFRCPHCQVGFSNNGQLKGHIRIHTGERPFKCDAEACGKSFTRNEELTRHRRIHSGLRPFPCPECGKRFGRKDHLKKHIKTHFQQRYQLVPILSSHCPYLGCGL